jgi:hypothetical protein
MEEYIYPSKGFTQAGNKMLGMGKDIKVIINSKLAERILKSEEKTISSLNSNEANGWPTSFILKMFIYPRFMLLCLTAISYGYKINIIYGAEMNVLFTKQSTFKSHNQSLKKGPRVPRGPLA